MKLIVSAMASLFISSMAFGKTCTQTIEGNDALQFNLKEIAIAKDCTEFNLTLKHVGKLPKSAMGHNWVLLEEKDFTGMIADSAKAGPANDFIPKGDARILASTKLLSGGESDTISVDLKKLKPGQPYTYMCTFPGHSGTMKGTLIIK